jgi:GH35 family endo-1,4-beta-xylanase
MARWCRRNGIRTKGHPLCWHEGCPRWLRTKRPEQVEALQMGRIPREVAPFRGLVDVWDVVNEAVVMPRHEGGRNPIARLCGRLTPEDLIRQTFAAARRANPKAVLLLNDFDTSPAYEGLIRRCLEAGVQIDAIGIQSHMHCRYWGARRVWSVCERFAKLGKPLHFTEATILSGALKTDDDWMGDHAGWVTTAAGEKRQARQAVELCKVLFAHPAVEAITWWGLSDLDAWQGAPAGLLRKDMSPKPAYEAIHKLIKGEWWTGPRRLRTDGAGRVRFRGFLGDYELQSAGRIASFRLEKAGSAQVTARLPKAK